MFVPILHIKLRPGEGGGQALMVCAYIQSSQNVDDDDDDLQSTDQ